MLVGAIFVTIVTGADVVRHDAGSTLPDVPLIFGEWWPSLSGAPAYAQRHRVAAFAAIAVSLVCFALARGTTRSKAVAAVALSLSAAAGLALHLAPLPWTPVEGVAHAALALTAIVAATASTRPEWGALRPAWAVVVGVVVCDALVAAGLRRVDEAGALGVATSLVVVLALVAATRPVRPLVARGLVAMGVLLTLRRAAVEWLAWAAPPNLDLPVSAVLAVAATWMALRPDGATTMDPSR